ncbi:MAG: right-handed parallel beta-helix repeat-containing protein [Planctomycetes bacterium]|nr:right-handed parallel beta-helix repeat-containing protein [Planctomycetota bacterium]
MSSRLLRPLALLALSPFVAAQNTLHVPAQYATVQSALDAAAAGDTVLVAPGTYAGALLFPGRDVVLRGGGAATTILQGVGFEPVITCAPGSTRLAVIEGFTIRGGNGFDAGGIHVDRCSPTIRDNWIVQNRTSARGGGIGVNFGSPRIERNRIAQSTQSIRQVFGGGISLLGAGAAEILDNVIEQNDALTGGGIAGNAAGTPTIRGNRIRGNNATEGGGLVFQNGSDALVVQNVIDGNTAARGGGIAHTNGNIVVLNNTIVGNAGTGSAVYAYRPIAVLTFVNNLMAGTGTLLYGDLWRPEIQHVFTHNLLDAPTVFGAQWPDWSGNAGVISAPAQLRADGLQLAAGSPARDAGMPRAELQATDWFGDPRVVGTAVDIGADEYAGRFPFGSQCGGNGRRLAIVAASGGLPELGNAAFAFDLRGGVADAAAMLALGDSTTSWNGMPLPRPLDPYGLPGCAQAVSVLHWMLLPTDSAGACTTGCPIPNAARLRGVVLHAQWTTLAGPIGQPGVLEGTTGGLTIELF